MPMIAIFICEIDEYAIMRLMSTWRSVENDVYRMDTIQSVVTAEAKYLVASGNIGNNTRRNP
jgi:hypothetical protein